MPSLSIPSAIFLLGLCLIAIAQAAADRQQQCETPGTCSSSNNGCPTAVCLPAAAAQDSVYRFGGTAQAYKADVPTNTSICEAASSSTTTYRVATWPYRRASYSSSSNMPRVSLSVNLLTCGEDSKKSLSCCCQAWNSRVTTATVEAWQTRPDGTFASLREGEEEGDCRAQQTSTKGLFEFETLPPGSYGSLGGLGPNGWDFMPYGEPVLHFLVTAEAYAPTLVDVPIYFHAKTLESKTFGWNDWRGTSWMRRQKETGYEVVSWKADAQQRTISIALNIFLQKKSGNVQSTAQALCESSIYGFPSSFFREPISLCGNSLLDFFEL